MEVRSGGTAGGADVFGELIVDLGGAASGTTIEFGGTELVSGVDFRSADRRRAGRARPGHQRHGRGYRVAGRFCRRRGQCHGHRRRRFGDGPQVRHGQRTIIKPGGVETVSGTDVGAQISAGEQDVFGLANGATIFVGGDQSIESGGTASGTTVLLGGAAQVFSGAVALDTVVSNAGCRIHLWQRDRDRHRRRRAGGRRTHGNGHRHHDLRRRCGDDRRRRRRQRHVDRGR